MRLSEATRVSVDDLQAGAAGRYYMRSTYRQFVVVLHHACPVHIRETLDERREKGIDIRLQSTNSRSQTPCR